MDKELLLYNYFVNRLTEEDRRLLNELLETDPEFKAQFDFENDLKRVIKKNENENLKTRLNSFEQEVHQKGKDTRSKWGLKHWSMAASIVLLIGLSWIAYNSFSGPDLGELYAANFETYPNTVYTITRSDGEKSLERDAFAAYEAGDYDKSATAFLDLKTMGGTTHTDFYLAQSYLHLGKDNEAIEALIRAISNDTEFKAEANWYLALAYLKDKDEVNAIATLHRQIKDFYYNRTKAEALLKELD